MKFLKIRFERWDDTYCIFQVLKQDSKTINRNDKDTKKILFKGKDYKISSGRSCGIRLDSIDLRGVYKILDRSPEIMSLTRSDFNNVLATFKAYAEHLGKEYSYDGSILEIK